MYLHNIGLDPVINLAKNEQTNKIIIEKIIVLLKPRDRIKLKKLVFILILGKEQLSSASFGLSKF